MASRIEDYALIGDCETAALVGRDGSIDWLSFPRFDSAACFAALLGTPDHGRWVLAPETEIKKIQRSYRPGTLVLETEYYTDSGAVRLIDFMPPRTRTPELIRIVEGMSGHVPMAMDLGIRFDYGSVVPLGSTLRGWNPGDGGTGNAASPYSRAAHRSRPSDRRTFLRCRRRACAIRAGLVTHARERAATDGSGAESSRDGRMVDVVVRPLHVPWRVA